MEGQSEFTVNDWIEHLRFVYKDLQDSIKYNGKHTLYITTLFIGSLLFSLSSNNHFYLGIIGMGIAGLFYYIVFTSNISLFNQSTDIEKLLNHMLVYDNLNINDIRIEFMEISFKHGALGARGQKRLNELKRKRINIKK